MMKVVVADDEKKLCRLIQMLCDWESLAMQIVGFAHDGPETIEMVQEKKPDILIVDIRMPGCDGIEVIRQIRELGLPMEIIIVSGYADFAYAKAAITHGVSGYLLKPIKKTELEEALKQAKESIEKERHRVAADKKLHEYMEEDNMKKRSDLIFDLPMRISFRAGSEIESVNKRYYYQFVPGFFQFFILRLHYSMRKYDKTALQKTVDSFETVIQKELEAVCSEYEICIVENKCYVLCNYVEKKESDFRKAIRSIINKLSAKRFEMWKMTFSAALGKKVKSPVELWDSLESAQEGLKEAVIEGCEKLLEMPKRVGEKDWLLLISRFNNEFTRVLDLCDETLIVSCIEKLKKELNKEKDILGKDYISIVVSLGMHAMTKSGNDREEIAAFSEKCELCRNLDELFDALKDCLLRIARKNIQMQREDGRRPVRIAKQYMQNHYREGISLEEVAGIVGFSPAYFSSLLKKEMGIGFSEYLIQLRMEKAKELLKESNENVKDICRKVGYSDLKHFNALFKKYTGIKPGEYRKLYG
ncbi:MAG: response regulator [bacterium]|nr:response regulator [bacterium]